MSETKKGITFDEETFRDFENHLVTRDKLKEEISELRASFRELEQLESDKESVDNCLCASIMAVSSQLDSMINAEETKLEPDDAQDVLNRVSVVLDLLSVYGCHELVGKQVSLAEICKPAAR